ncbi:winged helix-turn-helix transcriptional regulator [Phytoactinopolyspora endophytica]|uniref:winged helix-turn-helix transcriptional regulator n=1 Tax=Phytoactinopolyspora endophytica TaxID=1642495 RepID=UPI00101E1E7B|nr:helix-turn-helix domain-containing protein [Phytoactinopolyspora endophytica]
MAAALSADVEWTDPTCPVARAVDLVGDRWILLIIRDAMDGASTFTDFHQRLGVARNILSDRLRRLVEHGILSKEAQAVGKRHVYALTEAGEDLFIAIVAMRQWGERHAFSPEESHSSLVDRAGEPVPELQLPATDGNPLTAATTHVRKVS